MLKSIVNGAEHDIVSIPMKGKNLFNPNGVTTNERGETRTGVELPAGAYCITNLSNAACYWRIGVETTTGNQINPSDPYVFIRASDTLVVWVGPTNNKNIMVNEGSTALQYEPYGYQNGWEIRDNQNRIIWGREDELQTITGTLQFKGYDLPIKVKSLLGNATQNGTPSPDNVVIPEMCGVRTENLFDESTAIYGKYIDSSGVEQTSSTGENNHSDYIPISAGVQYTLSETKPAYTGIVSAIAWYTENKQFIQRDSVTLPEANGRKSNTFVAPLNAAFAIINFYRYPNYDGENDMLNSGSTALPYEPYGWAIEIEVI